MIRIDSDVHAEAWEYASNECLDEDAAIDLCSDILDALSAIEREDTKNGTRELDQMLYGPWSVTIKEFSEDRGLADKYKGV